MTRNRLPALIACLLLLSACSDETAAPAQSAAEPAPAVTVTAEAPPTPAPAIPQPRAVASAQSAPTSPPLLHARLPAEALAYLRVPSVIAMLGTPKGSIYDAALGSAAWSEAVIAIRDGINENVLPELPEDRRAAVALLLVHARSPIEAVAIPSPLPQSPLPDVLVTVAMDFPGGAEFGGFVRQASQSFPLLELPVPLDADGAGVLRIAGEPVPIRYRDSRLWLLISPLPDPARLALLVDGLQPSPDHPLRRVEAQLDAGGQGLLAWTDAPRVLERLQAAGRAEQVAALIAMGAGEARSVAVGMGASGGIHRTRIVLEMPQVGLRSFVPTMRSKVTLEAAGTPEAVGLAALPSPADLSLMEQGLVTVLPPEKLESYLEAKKQLSTRLGFTLEELLGAIGQDALLIFDEAGQYAAVRIRDAAAFDTLLARTVERFGASHEQRTVAGATIHHLTIPALTDLVAREDEAGQPLTAIEKRLLGVPNHVYWLREGEYLIAASTPHSLIDRQYVAQRTPIADWLREDQRTEADGALLLASGRARRLPAIIHELNVQLLAFLGDFVGRPVDLFALPTARELGLPAEGAFGVRVGSTESELSVELSYENNPFELLAAGGGSTGIATVGILAAVAVPAYQDYTVKAKVHEGVAAVRPLRDLIERFASENGRLPTEAELAGLDLSSLQSETAAVDVIAPGAVRLRYQGIAALGDENTLTYVPRLAGGGVSWTCESDLPAKFLPPDCRP